MPCVVCFLLLVSRLRHLVGIGSVCLLLLSPWLNGCGNESESADTGATMAPRATITFPGSTALLTSGQVTVRGTAHSDHIIARVEVNGLVASSTNGFANWEVALYLPLGSSVLLVLTEDVLGHRNAAAAQATVTVTDFLDPSRARLDTPRGITVERTGQLFVVEAQRVVRIDPAASAYSVVSDATTGTGLPFGDLQGIAVEATGHLVVVETTRVVRVDPVSGARTTVSGVTTGGGPSFESLAAIAVDASGQLVVLDRDRILRVDPQDGTRTIVSDASASLGPPDGFPPPLPCCPHRSTLQAIAVETDGQFVVLEVYGTSSAPERQVGRVLRVDPSSGARTLLVGLSDNFARYRYGVALEPSGQLVVLEVTEAMTFEPGPIPVWNQLIRVDPRSGLGAVISSGVSVPASGIRTPPRGTGPSFGDLRGIAVESAGPFVVADDGLGIVMRVEPESGDRAILSR